MKLLGIDVGTGGTRAVVIDETGSVVAAATAEHVLFASPQTGWAEQEILAAEEGAAYGAGLLAGVGAGVWSTVEQACTQAVPAATRIQTGQKSSAALMNDRQTAYRALYGAQGDYGLIQGFDSHKSE